MRQPATWSRSRRRLDQVGRKPKQAAAAVDYTAVIDRETGGLSESYKRTVAAVLPPGVAPTEAFWQGLGLAVGTYVTLQRRRASRNLKREQAKWVRIERLATELGREVRILRRRMPWTFGLSPAILPALWEIKDKADAHVVAYSSLRSAFGRRKDPYRAHLYGALIGLWRGPLGQELHYTTKGPQGIPSGRPVRFLAACLNPILGADAPGAHGIAAIIDRERRG